MTNVSKIGEKIKIFRKKLGLQANKLAEQLNISPSYLNLIENGKRNIDAGLLLKICQELRIELSELENFEEINNQIVKNNIKYVIIFDTIFSTFDYDFYSLQVNMEPSIFPIKFLSMFCRCFVVIFARARENF